jgi:hypothetical protein
MRIAKPILLVTTPIGVAGGVYEAWKVSPGLAFLMGGLILAMAFAVGALVVQIRAEQRGDTTRSE